MTLVTNWDIRQAIGRFSENDAILLDAAKMRPYEYRWVAVSDGAVVATADSIPDLMPMLDAAEVPLRTCAIRFIGKDGIHY